MKTIKEIMKNIAEADNYSIALEAINIFRKRLFPAYSRSLWTNVGPMSPLHPELLPIVFKWKKSGEIYVDLKEIIPKE
jgi:hypothetical protein